MEDEKLKQNEAAVETSGIPVARNGLVCLPGESKGLEGKSPSEDPNQTPQTPAEMRGSKWKALTQTKSKKIRQVHMVGGALRKGYSDGG